MERAKLQSVGFNAHPSKRLALMLLAVVSTESPLKKNGRSCVSADYCEVRSVGESRSPGAHGQHMVVRPVSHCQDLKGVP